MSSKYPFAPPILWCGSAEVIIGFNLCGDGYEGLYQGEIETHSLQFMCCYSLEPKCYKIGAKL